MLLETFIKGGKPVAGICYGSIALAQVKDSLTGVYLLQGHFATGHGDADNYTEDTATMNPDGTNSVRHTYWIDKMMSRCSSVIG